MIFPSKKDSAPWITGDTSSKRGSIEQKGTNNKPNKVDKRGGGSNQWSLGSTPDTVEAILGKGKK